MSDQGIEDRLARQEAIEGTRGLIARYTALLDRYGPGGSGDPEAIIPLFADLFAEDAVLKNRQGEISGRGKVMEYYQEVAFNGPLRFCRHLAYNQTIEVLAADHTVHDAQWIAFGIAGESSTVRFGGYHDELILQDGVWRFLIKGNETNLIGDLEQGWATAEIASLLF